MHWKGSHNFFGNDDAHPTGAYHPASYVPPQQYPTAQYQYPPAQPPHRYPMTNEVNHPSSGMNVNLDPAHLTRADANPGYNRIKEFFTRGRSRDRQAQRLRTPSRSPTLPDLSYVLTDTQSLGRYPNVGHQVPVSAAGGSVMHAHPHQRLPEHRANRYDGRPDLGQINDLGVMKNPTREPPDEEPESSSESEGETTPGDVELPHRSRLAHSRKSKKAAYPAIIQYVPHIQIDHPPSYNSPSQYSVGRASAGSRPPSERPPSLIYSQYNGHISPQTGASYYAHGTQYHQMSNHGMLMTPAPSAQTSTSSRKSRKSERRESRSSSQPASARRPHHHRHGRSTSQSSEPYTSSKGSPHARNRYSDALPSPIQAVHPSTRYDGDRYSSTAPVAITVTHSSGRHSDGGHSHRRHHHHDGDPPTTTGHRPSRSWNPPSALSTHHRDCANSASMGYHPRFDLPPNCNVPEDRSRYSRPPLTPPPHPRPFELRGYPGAAYVPVYPDI